MEFNECEDNEYRCEDGSCIPEQYWLDGSYDCSDKSDEQNLAEYFLRSNLCPLTSSQFICDETTAHQRYFACGDGDFKHDLVGLSVFLCYNYRNIMFFCEYLSSEEGTYYRFNFWTLENGHCVDQDRIQKSVTDMNELEGCLFYLKCKITNRKATGCDDVMRHFHPICKNKTINYPSEPVLKPYVQIVYKLSESDHPFPSYAFFNGSIKCIGYQARSDSPEIQFDWFTFQDYYPSNYLFCNNSEKKLESGPQIDKNCWNNTKQSFLCQKSLQCISKHRLLNNRFDCSFKEDESSSERCYMKNKHRFDCTGNLSYCLLVFDMGDWQSTCHSGVDEYITPLKWILAEHKCTAPNSIECNVLKTYIQSPLSILSTKNSKVLLFREYCDTVWHLSRGFDESLCNEWKCPKDQYQCLTGHCIPIKHVTGQINNDWHCPDASDYIELWGITQRSEHNIQIISDSLLQEKRNTLIYTRDFSLPFHIFCNISKQYGCILNNVTDPLNFTINRPCINLTQIGDGIIDCYGGLDERNLLTCGNNTDKQQGFDFHCSDQECIPYHLQCKKQCSNKADSLLCDQLPTFWNSTCKLPRCTRICADGEQRSYLFGRNSYYCDFTRLCK